MQFTLKKICPFLPARLAFVEHNAASMAEKRMDYFAAGTLVVWDVDVLRDEVVRVYRVSDQSHPTLSRRGEVAEAEPALPGWTMPVDDIFL